MPDDKKEIVNQISDEALDALLTQWAEDEIEPPAGFHAKTMERLRMEQQNKNSTRQKGKIIPFFVQKKKWMSVAAAAVLLLCCIPVVQAQFGDVLQPTPKIPQEQTKDVSNNDTGVGAEGSTENQLQGNVENDIPVDTITKQDDNKQESLKKKNDVQDSKTSGNRDSVNTKDTIKNETLTTAPVNQTVPESAVADSPTVQNAVPQAADAQTPAVVQYYSMDNEDAAVGGGEENQGVLQQRRSVEGAVEQTSSADATSYQASLEELETKLQNLQRELDENTENLNKNPEDQEIKDHIEDLQEEIDILKKEIEQLKNLVEEAKTATE